MLAANPILLLAPQASPPPDQETSSQPGISAGFLPILKPALEPGLPIRNFNVAEPNITAQSALVYDATANRILLAKDIFTPRPIASLTKIFTAFAANEKIKPEQEITISKQAVETLGEIGDLQVGEKMPFSEMLYFLLVASSNDAAVAVAENYPGDLLADINHQAKTWDLVDTVFADISGLSPSNHSTAWEITRALIFALQNETIKKVMGTNVIDIPSRNSQITNHHLINTNRLLNLVPGVFAGKTGYTEEAGECLLVAFFAPNNDILIAAILNSQDRLGEAGQLISWARQGYVWQ